MTAECCNRRACSCGVIAEANAGTAGVVFEAELRLRFSIAGKELLVAVVLRGAVTVT